MPLTRGRNDPVVIKDIADCNIHHFKLQHTLNQTTRPSQIGMLYEVIEMATHLIWVYIIIY